ncbi:MAG: hypothetical protein RR709_05835, partial [Ruthenibacterium sp.]
IAVGQTAPSNMWKCTNRSVNFGKINAKKPLFPLGETPKERAVFHCHFTKRKTAKYVLFAHFAIINQNAIQNRSINNG